MLVITRKEGESLEIGDSIRVVVIRSGNRVQLGIEAPDSTKVLRSELTKRENASEER